MSKSKNAERYPVDAFISGRIKHFRGLRGITQKQLAEKVGIKFQQVQKYETGVSRISAFRLYLACEAFGITVPEFFSEFYEKEGREIPKASTNEGVILPHSFLKIPRKKRRQFAEFVKNLAELMSK